MKREKPPLPRRCIWLFVLGLALAGCAAPVRHVGSAGWAVF